LAVFPGFYPAFTSHIIKNFYLGEVLKLTISGVLLVIAFKFLSVDTLAFLAGYITAVLSIWLFIPFTFNKSGKV
jgi:F0F1-type ATP synthase assembly protein I